MSTFGTADDITGQLQVIFTVIEEEAAAIELRRYFPGITDNGKAPKCARSIAGWKPLNLPPRPPVRPRVRKGSRSGED